MNLRQHLIGIDPSLTGTGIATEDGMRTVRGEGDLRLAAIHREVNTAAHWMDPAQALAVVEDLPIHAQGAGKTGMAQGVVRLALMQVKVEYVLVTGATLKKFATGRGNCTKPDMRMELFKRAALDIRDDNQVDAWWLREIGLHATGQPTIELPKTHRDALLKVEWPADIAEYLLLPYERYEREVLA